MACLHDATQILPGLWVGSLASVKNGNLLLKAGITHVITCLSYSEVAERNLEIPESIQWTIVPVEDEVTDTIFPHIETVVNTIGNVHRENERARSTRGRVLIHCMGGISRSPSLAAAYVIWRLRLRWVAAVAYVRERRPCADPNPRFLKDLETFDRAVFRDETISTVPNKNR